ncbi:MAG: ABC transporter ATP-binding protein [Acidobacteriota bacterium]
MDRPFLALQGIEKRFGDQRVLDDISLEVAEGEILALLGPSGSGKTTLLRLLAGFEHPNRGSIRVDGLDVAPLPPAKRRFGMVFQHYALFPHLTVGENVAFGLESVALPVAERARRIAEMLELVDLAGFEQRRVGEISGGQQQRVALARALAPQPKLLLLDEPLSNLDPALRERTRRELAAAFRRVGITTVLVTHEQEEAFDLGDRVAVLHAGRLAQVGRPEELYGEPATPFVAGFVGRASRLSGRVTAGGQGIELEAGVTWPAVNADDLADGAAAELVVRPESLALSLATAEGSPAVRGEGLTGTVVGRRFTGPLTYFQVVLATGTEIEVLAPSDAARLDEAVIVSAAGNGPRPRLFAPGKLP